MPVMTSAQQQPLTLEEFKKLLNVCYSHPDSQLRAAEEATAGHWETVLTLVSGKNEGMGAENTKTLVLSQALEEKSVVEILLSGYTVKIFELK